MKVLVDLFVSWFKMGLFTFGGGYAMLPMIQREVIEKHKWASEDEIMNYYAIGQCTPGIIAVNTATFVGYSVSGIKGAIVSTLGVISPSIIIITLIANLISNFSEIVIVQRALSGIKVGVSALMIIAIYKLFKSNVKDLFSIIILFVTLGMLYFKTLSNVLLVCISGIIGVIYFSIKDRGIK